MDAYLTARLDLAGDLAIKQRASYALTIELATPDGSPFDLTGCTATAQLRRSLSATSAIDFFAEIDPDPTTGRIVLLLPPETTATLLTGNWVWDLFLELPGGLVWSPLEGDAVVKGAVTRE